MVGRRIVAALTLVAYLVDARVGGVRSMCVLRTGFWFVSWWLERPLTLKALLS